jgi:hypothetical protein
MLYSFSIFAEKSITAFCALRIVDRHAFRQMVGGIIQLHHDPPTQPTDGQREDPKCQQHGSLPVKSATLQPFHAGLQQVGQYTRHGERHQNGLQKGHDLRGQTDQLDGQPTNEGYRKGGDGSPYHIALKNGGKILHRENGVETSQSLRFGYSKYARKLDSAASKRIVVHHVPPAAQAR